ncbi:hypothetical protein FBU30_001794 [Linnemannia zychae]|nr:hypothetical protein FBU30_001794 [Linnemannia zychae]
MFTSIDKGATDENLIQIGLEADMIRHKGLYEIEIVFSEEKSSNMNPSPSSCHRLFDSLYHNIAATSLPDMSTADIWFELYSPPPMTIRAKSMKILMDCDLENKDTIMTLKQ